MKLGERAICATPVKSRATVVRHGPVDRAAHAERARHREKSAPVGRLRRHVVRADHARGADAVLDQRGDLPRLPEVMRDQRMMTSVPPPGLNGTTKRIWAGG
jgi:hypothetical protein